MLLRFCCVALLMLMVVITATTASSAAEDMALKGQTEVSVSDQEWESFKKRFHKSYELQEDQWRRDIYLKNKIIIAEHNKKYQAGLVTFRRGINKYADMTEEERNCVLFARCPENMTRLSHQSNYYSFY